MRTKRRRSRRRPLHRAKDARRLAVSLSTLPHLLQETLRSASRCEPRAVRRNTARLYAGSGI
jgi:hypothetical protein